MTTGSNQAGGGAPTSGARSPERVHPRAGHRRLPYVLLQGHEFHLYGRAYARYVSAPSAGSDAARLGRAHSEGGATSSSPDAVGKATSGLPTSSDS
jgi:hypothetical protein